MAVVVRLRLEPAASAAGGCGVLEAAAVVNTGYRADELELSLPGEAARHLGLYPHLPALAVPVEVRGYAGSATVWHAPGALRVSVVTPDRAGPTVTASVLISPAEDEILISDALAGDLGLLLINPRTGLWRFRDEPPDLERPSEPPRFW